MKQDFYPDLKKKKRKKQTNKNKGTRKNDCKAPQAFLGGLDP